MFRRTARPILTTIEHREQVPEILQNGALGHICFSNTLLQVPQDMLTGGTRIGSNEGHAAVYRLVYNGIVVARKDVRVQIPSGESQESINESMRKQLREVDVIKSCSPCPFIVHFYGYYVHKVLNYVNIHIFMEELAMSASSLKNAVSNKGWKIPEFVIGRIACSVIHALRFLKENLKIIHRDVKPSNILIDYDGRVKICDFGISGILENSVATTVNGCQQYTAPEIHMQAVSETRGYSVKTDIWSLGITVYEIATLQFPYDTDSTQVILIGQISSLNPPRLVQGEFSDNLVTFVERLLQRQPDDRPTLAGVQSLAFFMEHDVPFSFIGTGVGIPREDGNADRPSVGAWLDELFFS